MCVIFVYEWGESSFNFVSYCLFVFVFFTLLISAVSYAVQYVGVICLFLFILLLNGDFALWGFWVSSPVWRQQASCLLYNSLPKLFSLCHAFVFYATFCRCAACVYAHTRECVSDCAFTPKINCGQRAKYNFKEIRQVVPSLVVR